MKEREPVHVDAPHSTSHTSSPPPPRLALTVSECAQSLGVSLDYFNANIRPELRGVRRGRGDRRKVIISVRELQRWLDDHGERLG